VHYERKLLQALLGVVIGAGLFAAGALIRRVYLEAAGVVIVLLYLVWAVATWRRYVEPRVPETSPETAGRNTRCRAGRRRRSCSRVLPAMIIHSHRGGVLGLGQVPPSRGAGNNGARNSVSPSSLLNIVSKGGDYSYGHCWRWRNGLYASWVPVRGLSNNGTASGGSDLKTAELPSVVVRDLERVLAAMRIIRCS